MRALFLGVLLVMTTADAGKRKRKQADMPTWFLTPPEGCAGGSAIFDPNMREIARVEADTAARAQLTRQISTSVQTMVTQVFEKRSGSGGSTNASANTTSVTKSATEQVLLGARAVSSEIMDGQLYLLLCIQPESLVKAFEEMAYLDDAMKVALGEGARTTYAAQTQQLQALGFN